MSARRLSYQEAAPLVLKYNVTYEQIPSYGLRIEDNNKDYLIGVNHNINELVVFDITAYDDSGNRIDPMLLEYTWIDLWHKAISESVVETAKDLNPFQLGSLGNILVISAIVILAFMYWPRR